MSVQALERFIGGVLASEYKPVRTTSDRGYDFISHDGKRVVDAKLALHSGSRDFKAAVLSLASALAREPGVSQAILLIRVGRLSSSRALDEWKNAKDLLREDLSGRMALVLFAPDRDVVVPETPELQRLQALVTVALANSTQPKTRLSVPWSPRVLEVWKVIVDAWLRGEPPLQVREIEERSGTSYPTVAAALDLLHERDEIERLSSRSVRLRGFPRRSLGEILVLERGLRQTTFFRDRTSKESDPLQLLQRLRRKLPRGIAIGGVIAARYYDGDFDLNGTPRLDITMARDAPPSWWRETDPALESVPRSEPSVVMVAHALFRPEPRFERVPNEPLPLADPTETLLDLYELRLEAQAQHMVLRLRARSENV